MCPHTAPCVWQPQRDRRNRDWVSGPHCCLHRQASDEQLLAFAVSLDANTARIFSQWHFPLDIATARSSPISFIFLFVKVTLSLKRKVLIFIQRKKTCFSISSLSPFPKLAPWHFLSYTFIVHKKIVPFFSLLWRNPWQCAILQTLFCFLFVIKRCWNRNLILQNNSLQCGSPFIGRGAN